MTDVTTKIPWTPPTIVAEEHLHIGPASVEVCEIHAWTLERKLRELVPLMRERHGKGGLTVCVECIDEMKAEADRRRRAKREE